MRTLASYEPFLVAANVRGRFDLFACTVEAGRGRTGDLVLGELQPPPECAVTLLDSERRAHNVSAPCRVVAVLGPRDSSTHVCATIPSDGLNVVDGTPASWVAGESGIVGCLERPPAAGSVYHTEQAVPFRCTGLVADRGGVLSVRRFAIGSTISRGSIPIVMMAATSSEAGKTVLAGLLIRRLTRAGRRVGAIKVTGTGGVMDLMHYLESGAMAALDQVDAGLITTHGDEGGVRLRIPSLFLRIQELGADLIVAELGGDLLSGNNPVLFGLPEIIDRTALLLVIANDALSAAGVIALNEARLRYPVERVRFFSSPFRNHAGMRRRMIAAGVPEVLDPNSDDDLDRLAVEVAALGGQSTHDRVRAELEGKGIL